MSRFGFENVEPEFDPGVMAMIVLSFNECCVEMPDRTIEKRRAAGRSRIEGHGRLPKAKKEIAATNWSSWFAHHYGPQEEVSE